MSLWKKLLRGLARAGSVLTALVLAALACLALILAQPQEAEEAEAVSQPPLTPSPAMTIASEADLRDLVAAFPVPVMSFMSGSGMVFVSGSSADAALDGGFGRVLTLNWQTPDGIPVILQSIYPASGLKLLENGAFHFSRAAGPALFGLPSVRMESADRLRIHAATDTGLYAVILPKVRADALPALAQSLQLFTAEPAP